MRKTIDIYLSNKISVLSFIAMIGVLLIHTTYNESINWPWLYYLQRYLSSISNCAVPFFFIISGYFFFLKITDFKSIVKGIKKRARSLLVPYLLWCLIFILTVALIGEVIDLNNDYFGLLKQGKFWDFIVYVFWSPAAFHLWYIRDLMIVILISPLIYVTLRKCPVYTLICGYILFGYFRVTSSISWAIWWIILGGYFGVRHEQPLLTLPKNLSISCLCLGLLSVGLLLLFRMPFTPEYKYTIPIMLVCIIGFWTCYDYIHLNVNKILYLTDFTFAIYCMHIPMLNVFKKIFFPIIDDSWLGCLLGYVLSPILTIAIIYCICKFLKYKTFKLYSVLYGGR